MNDKTEHGEGGGKNWAAQNAFDCIVSGIEKQGGLSFKTLFENPLCQRIVCESEAHRLSLSISLSLPSSNNPDRRSPELHIELEPWHTNIHYETHAGELILKKICEKHGLAKPFVQNVNPEIVTQNILATIRCWDSFQPRITRLDQAYIDEVNEMMQEVIQFCCADTNKAAAPQQQ